MRILCVDVFAESVLDWLLRCRDDGHQIIWHFDKSKKTESIGRGFGIEITHSWQDHFRWADLVFATDNVKHIHGLDAARLTDPKKAVIAPSIATAAWETDRLLGQSVLRKHGIPTPPCREFTSFDDAIRYVKKQDQAFACKPCGNETDKSLSYVAKSPADLVFKLELWKRTNKLTKGSFILQEKISGIEMGVGGWFGPGGFSAGWEENWEEKKLMPGNLGPNTGEMGTTLRFVRRSKLADKVLKPLAATLEKMGYVGCVDVNCLIDDKGTPWPLEFTMRPGWPSFNIQQALHSGDHAEWLVDLARGQSGKPPWRLNEIAVGAVLAIPPFPNDHAKMEEVVGVPICGITEKNRPNIHPCMMMSGEAPQNINGKVVTGPCLLTAGDYVLVASGVGSTVQSATRATYRVLASLEVPASPMWRTDIGRRLARQLPELQKHGYAAEMMYSAPKS